MARSADRPSEKAMAAARAALKQVERGAKYAIWSGSTLDVEIVARAFDAFAEEARAKDRERALNAEMECEALQHELATYTRRCDNDWKVALDKAVEEARREEREACCKTMCRYCAGRWVRFDETPHFADHKWWHQCKRHLGKRDVALCDASAIRSRSSRPPEAGAGGGEEA